MEIEVNEAFADSKEPPTLAVQKADPSEILQKLEARKLRLQCEQLALVNQSLAKDLKENERPATTPCHRCAQAGANDDWALFAAVGLVFSLLIFFYLKRRSEQ